MSLPIPDPGRAQSLADIAARIIAPQKKLNVSEWADQHRVLSSKSSSESGQWQTSRTPYLREIMDDLSDRSPTQRIVFVKSAQVGATEAGLNWMGWFIGTQRAPMMCVQPTIEMAERFSKQRFAPMIAESEQLSAIIPPARSRNSGNTTLLKEYAGGTVILSGANSAASFRSMPAKYLFLDEVDAYPHDLDGEGSPIGLAEARLSTFSRRKIFLCSTPTIEILSIINREWLASDQRRYHVPCPHCGIKAPLAWDNLRWPEGQPNLAVYQCPHCNADIAEHHKTKMLANGEWIAAFPERPVHGYHINGLYTPIGLGLSWKELAAEYARKAKDPIEQKTFINTRLGECFEDPNETVDWEELKGRATGYEIRTIPAGCLLLTAGVDVQKDRFALLILGHGRDGICWVIDYIELPADPTRPQDWAILDDALDAPLSDSQGRPYKIAATAVDSGYLTDDVLNYTRARKGKVIATKGSATPGRSIIGRPSKVDFTWRGTTIKAGAEQWQIGTDTAKSQLFARLISDRKRLPQDRMVHFPVGLDDSFYSQLTAEIYDTTKRKWVKIRPRNEVLDCINYAVAASRQPSLRIHTWKEQHWQKWESMHGLHAPSIPRPAESTFTRPAIRKPVERKSVGHKSAGRVTVRRN